MLLVVIITAVLFIRSAQLTLLRADPDRRSSSAIALAFRKIARQSHDPGAAGPGQVNGMIQETMRGIAVAKSFRQEADDLREFEEVSDRTYRIRLRQGFIFSGIFPILFAVAGLGTTALV